MQLPLLEILPERICVATACHRPPYDTAHCCLLKYYCTCVRASRTVRNDICTSCGLLK